MCHFSAPGGFLGVLWRPRRYQKCLFMVIFIRPRPPFRGWKVLCRPRRFYGSCVAPGDFSNVLCRPRRFFCVLGPHLHQTAAFWVHICIKQRLPCALFRPPAVLKNRRGRHKTVAVSCECGTRTQKNRRGRHKTI